MDFSSGQFGGSFGDNGGKYNGGDDFGVGQFPSMDDMFSQMGDSDDNLNVDAFIRKAKARNTSRFVDVGLYFCGVFNHKK